MRSIARLHQLSNPANKGFFFGNYKILLIFSCYNAGGAAILAVVNGLRRNAECFCGLDYVSICSAPDTIKYFLDNGFSGLGVTALTRHGLLDVSVDNRNVLRNGERAIVEWGLERDAVGD